MKESEKPLLYIETVSILNENTQNQELFDSRYPRLKIEENKIFDNRFLENKKIENILKMYKQGRPVLCSVVLQEEELIGFPSKREGDYLVIVLSDDENRKVNISCILEINIIKF